MSEDENTIDVYEVVKKLIGPISPVGESHTDTKRLKNLKELGNLVDKLLTDINDIVWRCKNNHQHSMKHAVECAKKIFDDLNIKE